jgi:adenosylcobinamide-phosphate synthase
MVITADVITMIEQILPHGIDLRFMILAFAILADSFIGDPNLVWRRIPHPVVLFGKMITIMRRWGNKRSYSGSRRRLNGVVGIVVLTCIAGLLGAGIMIGGQAALTPLWGSATAGLIEFIVVAILLSGKSLDQHVKNVVRPLKSKNLKEARVAISMLVGRNPDQLDEHDIARAAIETTAENLSDGVIAPAFYYLILGLPGIVIYKMINTADSMIGYKSKDFAAFGTGAARLDDIVNLIPARLTGHLIMLAEPFKMNAILKIMWRDARKHRSPNAGWPEAAMAAVTGLSLAGPRRYGQRMSTDSPINPDGRRKATATDILIGLEVMWRVIILMMGLCLGAFLYL